MLNMKNWLKLPAFWIILVSLIILAILPAFTSSRFILNMAASIAIAASFAVSYNLLAGFTGVFSLGHAVFFRKQRLCRGDYFVQVWL